MKYEALSMQDIADHFDGLANSHADQSVNAKTKKAEDRHRAMAATWSAAARFIERCEVKA